MCTMAITPSNTVLFIKKKNKTYIFKVQNKKKFQNCTLERNILTYIIESRHLVETKYNNVEEYKEKTDKTGSGQEVVFVSRHEVREL